MSGPSKFVPRHPALKWFEARLPIIGLMYDSFVSYPTPRNLNFLWTFGAILSFLLIIQIVTGVVLVMHYTPNVDLAFNSVEHLMRDVNYGWLLRYLHSNGAAMFFFAVYIHMFRGMYYGSYKEPREVLWIIGVIIYLLMMATGFLGYVLPWGQMSYWAATVITNLFSAIPIFGETIVTWLWGGYSVGNPTLTRFFSLHYLLPFVIVAFVVLHVWALHVVGQNNPAGVEPKSDQDTVPFTPYATLKDLFWFVAFMLIYMWFTFYVPNYLGHADNYIPANPSVTPAHIVPEWYYLPFYAILRAIPDKLMGVIALFASIIVLAFLPWLDTSKVKSGRYRPLFKVFFWIFVADCLLLGWLGAKPAEGGYLIATRILTAWYFLHFIVVLPVIGLMEKPLPLPESITADALAKHGAKKKVIAATVAALAMLVGLSTSTRTAQAAGETPKPPQLTWSFSGPFGTFDRAQLQRGFQVYKEVCAACHGLSLLSFRNLAEPGGPGFTTAQAAAVAAEAKVKDGPNDQGEMFERPGRLADRFPSPYPNAQAAAFAFNGAAPPDLSVIAKARTYERGFPTFVFDIFTQYQEAGVDYITALLTGYEDTPADFKLPDGSNYNKYFPGHAIAMPPPLADGVVTYADGSPQTTAQYAKDVSAFLMWAAEPHLEARKRLGFQVMIFLLVLTGLMYFTYEKVWHDVKHPPEETPGQGTKTTRA
ncbi:Cytochrome b/c1 [Rhodoplanes serenus]|uniref:Cytochrome b n=1 Tax=Rhodoplanes serenus TaxID=200615 RepID=A0A447D198_9BRAD|nr:cytochrome c1 [Rhodoplanes serenus]VCU11294.1 Cytochrome b/c1 [Rhodoplanes serenus]